MSEVFERSKTQGNARLVLLSLADTCSDEGVCFPSIKTIAKKANISEETTRKFLHAFEKIGLVEAEERFSPVGRRTSNTYKLNLNKVGDDELTKDVIYLAIPKSKHRTSDGMNQFTPSPSNPVHTTRPMNQFIPSIMNHHNEPKIEPSRESSAVASHSSTQTNLFPTNPNEAHASGSATAELKSADGKGTTPPMPSAPPRNKKSRESKPVDEKFIAELQRLNPDKDVEREVKAAQTWLLSRPDRKYTRGFLANWVIRSKNIINPDKFHNNNSF
jgi:DNA-binding transcriptional regulator YhcF (GntR family)